MTYRINNWKFLHEFDLFGKTVGLYYKGRESRHTFLGSLFSLGFLLVYLSFFIYKLIRIFKKKDLIFYDTFEYLETPPSIVLNKDIFYGGFALENPVTYDPFIDETIYYPKAYFKKGIRNGDKWSFEIKEIELERCRVEKFGKAFQDKVIHNALNDLYCFKEMNETLEGHFSYDIYSFFYIEFFPCINSTNNSNHCKSLDIIDYYLTNTFVCFEMEDIELTPHNYTYPVRGRNQDIYFTVGKRLFQEVHVFYQLINVETNLNFFGFNELEHIKSQKYLKYYSQVQMTNLIDNNIYTTGASFSAVTIKLYDEVRIQRREYTKIIEVLGNIGGFMEVLFIFSKLICSFSTNILYEISLINNLFDFDLGKKLILVQKRDKYIYNENLLNKNKKKLCIQIKYKDKYTNKTIKNFDSEQNLIQSKLSFNINKKKTKENENLKLSLEPKIQNILRDRSSFLAINNINKNRTLFINDNKKNQYKNNDSDGSLRNSFSNEKEKKSQIILRKIDINLICVCFFFCCIKKRKNVQNILLKEGMKIITEQMDILKIFKKLLQKEEDAKNIQVIEMSNYCKENLKKLQ